MLLFLQISLCLSLDLYNYQNLQHYGYVKIGDQELPVMFDTGSTRTWIASIDCYSRGCNKHQKYDPYNSSTFKSLEISFELEYGSGSIRGQLATETLVLDNLVLHDIEIGLVTLEIGQVFDKIPFAGIIGLSPNKHPSSFLQQLISQLHISIISISLSQDPYTLGYISFGTAGAPTMQKSISNDYWEIELSEFYIGEYDLCDYTCNAVIDTGTSVIALPSPIHRKLRKEYHLQEDCGNADTFPSMSIGIASKVYEISSYEFIAYDQGQCSLTFMKLDVPEPVGPFFILGATFLRQVLLYLNIVNNEVGVVAKSGVFVKNKLIKI